MSSGTIDLTLTMDAQAVEETFTRAAARFPEYVNSWLVEAGELTKTTMSAKVNEGIGAAMEQGIKNNIDSTVDPELHTALVKPNKNVPYADGLETGTKPHRPPTFPDSALAQWCEMKGLNVYAVAATIARDGTKPHPFIAPTYEEVKEPVARLFADGMVTFLSQMGVAL